MKITGTSYFVSTRAAEKYYRSYCLGSVPKYVYEKTRAGEIHVGILPPVKAGQWAVLDKEEGRYFIYENEATKA